MPEMIRYPIGHNGCFWIPRIGVFELHNATKILSLLGLRLKHPYLCTPKASKGVGGYL